MPQANSALNAALRTVSASEIIGQPGERESVVLRACTVRQMPARVTSMLVSDNVTTADFVGQSDSSVTPTNLATGLKPVSNIGMSAKSMVSEEIAVVCIVPDAYIEDSSIDLGAFVREEMRQALAVRLDRAVLYGDGAPATWTDANLQAKAVAAGNARDTTTDAVADVAALLGYVEEDGFTPSSLIAAKSLSARLRDPRTPAGAPLPSPMSGGSIYGVRTDWMDNRVVKPSATGVKGVQAFALDGSRCVLGIREDIKFAISNETTINGVSMFQSDQTAFRAIFRVGFVTLNGAGNVPPYAVLQTPAL